MVVMVWTGPQGKEWWGEACIHQELDQVLLALPVLLQLLLGGATQGQCVSALEQQLLLLLLQLQHGQLWPHLHCSHLQPRRYPAPAQDTVNGELGLGLARGSFLLHHEVII